MLTQAAFDSVAATYDDEFTRTPIAQLMRRAVWARLDENFSRGMRVLELGCGTGEDAIYLAQRGVHVTATDASANMLAITRQKAGCADVSERVETRVLDMNAFTPSPLAPLPTWERGWGEGFDGVLSNFGALNCIANLQPLVSNFQQWTKPGARVILVVMGPFCPWEIIWHLLHLQPRQAFRRWSRHGVLAHIGGEQVRVFYPSPRHLIKLFSPTFKHIRTSGLGVLLPPPYVRMADDRRRTAVGFLVTGYWLLATANGIERRVDRFLPFSQCGDHYILELERV